MRKTRRIKIVVLSLVLIFTFFNIYGNANFYFHRENDGNTEIQYENTLKNLKNSGSYIESFIHVDNNWSATASTYDWCSGDGSWSNPYVIENVTIDAGGSLTASGIVISNSKNDYFIIRNCTIYNTGEYPNAGIKLENTDRGALRDNNCSIGDIGICLFINCNNNTIMGNTAKNTDFGGIVLIGSNFNTLTGNFINNSLGDGLHLNGEYNVVSKNNLSNNYVGISVDHCNDNYILENTIKENERGIWINWESYNNNVSGNEVSENIIGIYLFHDCHDNIISNNNVSFNNRGIFLQNVDTNYVINNTVNNNSWEGIYLKENCFDNVISNNTVNNSWNGINLTGQCNNNIITGNTVTNNGYTGISLENHCDTNMISGNTANYNWWGIFLENNSNNNALSENNMSNNNGVGLYINNSNFNMVSDNNFNFNIYDGLYAFSSNSTEISGNFLINNSRNGIFLDTCQDCIVSGNTAINNSRIGIIFDFCYNNEIIGNTVKENYYDGIQVYYSENIIITGNTANNNNYNGIVLWSSKDIAVSGNNAIGNTYNGIYLLYSNTSTITENTVEDTSYDGIYLFMSNINTISNNVVNNNSQYGIWLDIDSDSNTISENYVYFNPVGAICISTTDCDDNIIERNALVSNDFIFINDTGTNTIERLNYFSNAFPSFAVEIIEQSFYMTNFLITLKIMCEVAGFGVSDVLIQMWWDETNIPSNNITDLGDGLYEVSLTPKFVLLGLSPILLNMTISGNYHTDKNFEVYFAVEPPEKLLFVSLTNQEYSMQRFDFTFLICNEFGQGVGSADIQVWWGTTDISIWLIDFGNGTYSISCDRALIHQVLVGNPIWLELIIRVDGYKVTRFQTYITVELDFSEGGGAPDLFITITIISTVAGIGAATVITFLLLRRKRMSPVM